jgi:cephalosporin hydroxylase
MQEVTIIVILTTSHAMAKFLANDKTLCSSLTTKGQWHIIFSIVRNGYYHYSLNHITFFAAGPL